MRPTIPDPDLAEFLRLKSCPTCEYSLEMLPPAGICPECGRSYDQTYVVLTGVGRGRHDTAVGGTWRGSFGQIASVLFIAWIASSQGRPFFKDPFMVACIIAGAVALGTQLYGRLLSPSAPHMQLWLSPNGVSQILSTPEARTGQQAGYIAGHLMTPLVLILLAFQFHNPRFTLATALVITGVWGFFIVRFWRRHAQHRQLDQTNFVPKLWPWSQIRKIDVQTLANDRARIRCQLRRYWWKITLSDDWVVDIQIPCPPQIAEKLSRQNLRPWCYPITHPSAN